METRRPKLKSIKASEVREHWSELLNEVFRQESRIVVDKSGIPVAAIISARDLEWLQLQEAKWEQGFKVWDEIGAAFRDVPDEELEREVKRAVTEARRQLREEKQRAAIRS